MSPDDLIVAAATPPGGAVRAIVRIAGEGLPELLRRLLEPSGPTAAAASEWPPREATPRLLAARFAEARLVDRFGKLPCDVLLWSEGGPIGGPLAELQLPGCDAMTEAVVAAACRHGCRVPRGGEFTLRAFLAGRLDLLAAEAVLAVVDARSHDELSAALDRMAGGTGRSLEAVRQGLLEVAGDLEAMIDFGEEKSFDRAEIIEAFDRVTSFSVQYFQGDKWVNCADGTTLGDKIITFDKVTSSKVRLYIHEIKSDSASISEFKVALGDTAITSEEPTPAVCSRNAAGGMVVFLKSPAAQTLQDALDGMADVYDVEFETGKPLRYIHKIKDGKHIYFLANLDQTPITTEVRLRDKLDLEFWNPHTGEISAPKYTHEKHGEVDVTNVRITLPPIPSMFIVGQQCQ